MNGRQSQNAGKIGHTSVHTKFARIQSVSDES